MSSKIEPMGVRTKSWAKKIDYKEKISPEDDRVVNIDINDALNILKSNLNCNEKRNKSY